jgi:hypothetical protein
MVLIAIYKLNNFGFFSIFLALMLFYNLVPLLEALLAYKTQNTFPNVMPLYRITKEQ